MQRSAARSRALKLQHVDLLSDEIFENSHADAKKTNESSLKTEATITGVLSAGKYELIICITGQFVTVFRSREHLHYQASESSIEAYCRHNNTVSVGPTELRI